MSQNALAQWAKTEFGFPKLTQATVSTVLKEFRIASAGSSTMTIEQAQILYRKNLQSKMNQKQLAQWAQKEFNLAKEPSQSRISNIINQKRHMDENIPERDRGLKKKRIVKLPVLDNALAEWVLQCQERGVALNWQIVRRKATSFADQLNVPETDRPAFTDGWLEKFLGRHGLKTVKYSGERGSADVDAFNLELPAFQKLISEYKPSDVFNMDETGLFYCMAPDRTIASRQVGGYKKDKTRITIALTANADGSEKLELFFIGHFQKPRAFKKQSGEQLGINYRWNKKAWMTGLLFHEWLRKLDTRMRSQDRQILLLLDNAPTHGVSSIDLTNVTILFFPPNTTSIMQPMDAGIIAAFKKRYRSYQLSHALDRDAAKESDIYKVDILKAMRWCECAWKHISPISIHNCWLHTGLLDGCDPGVISEHESVTEVEVDDKDENLAEQINALAIRAPMSVDEYLAGDSEAIVHQEFSDADILKTFSVGSDDESDDPQTEADEDDIISTEQQLSALKVCLNILDDDPIGNRAGIETLRRNLYSVSRKLTEERLAALKQSDIRSYF
jgi:hypothetical protein